MDFANRAAPRGAMNIDQFLGSTNRGRRQKLLSAWKNSDSHQITIWLSTLAPILEIWRHNWLKIAVHEDRQTRATTREIWGDKIVCYEHQDTLKNQDWRDRATGKREHPPLLCPHCKMIEHVRGMVTSGEISWTTPVFAFKADDPSKNVTLLAGGLYNAFGAKELSAEQKAQMQAVPRDHGGPVYAKNAFKQNQKAKLEYAFTVVNDAKPEDGLQITIEPNLLGQKVQEVIVKSRKELGSDDGNPMLNPFAFLWEYNPADDVEFSKKYDATRLGKVKLRPAVEKLIRETDPPSLEQVAERFNLESHRANMERHSLIRLPFDEFFADARAEAKKPTRQTVPADVAPTPREQEVDRTHVDAPPADEELFDCDTEGCLTSALKPTDTSCPKCHRVYPTDGSKSYMPTPAAQQSAPASRKRSEAAAPAPVPQESINVADDDDIPF